MCPFSFFYFTDFDKYFLSLRPQLTKNECQFNSRNIISNNNNYKNKKFSENNQKILVNCRNIWFNEFWSQRHKCTFDFTATDAKRNNLTRCTGNEDLQNGYEQEGLVPFVIDAVYAMAKAIDDIINDNCGEYYDEDESSDYTECGKALIAGLSGHKLLEYIHKVKFKGPQGTEIRFNEDGDAYGYYNIYQYQKHDNKYDYVPVGTWKERYVFSLKYLFAFFSFFCIRHHLLSSVYFFYSFFLVLFIFEPL